MKNCGISIRTHSNNTERKNEQCDCYRLTNSCDSYNERVNHLIQSTVAPSKINQKKTPNLYLINFVKSTYIGLIKRIESFYDCSHKIGRVCTPYVSQTNWQRSIEKARRGLSKKIKGNSTGVTLSSARKLM